MNLLPEVTCPHCWRRFSPDDVLWIAEDPRLLGDLRLGSTRPLRFRPSRFTAKGAAIDPHDTECSKLACPECHLYIPEELLRLPTVFFSVVGAVASGKSYFLASSTWTLRQHLHDSFGLHFSHRDGEANLALSTIEQRLFNNPRGTDLVPLGRLIPKTDSDGEDLYDRVDHENLAVHYPKPILFLLSPAAHHPNFQRAGDVARVVCLYDLPGEHFLPGTDSPSRPVTRYLARSDAFLMLFDPTMDPRFRSAYQAIEPARTWLDPPSEYAQESIFDEAVRRSRQFLPLPEPAKHRRPLILVLPKFDVWHRLIGNIDASDPWADLSAGAVAGLDVERIQALSRRIRRMLIDHSCSEIVSAAERFASRVVYIPVSALGSGVEPMEDPGHPGTLVPGIRPERIRPWWISVPIFQALQLTLPELVGRRRADAFEPSPS